MKRTGSRALLDEERREAYERARGRTACYLGATVLKLLAIGGVLVVLGLRRAERVHSYYSSSISRCTTCLDAARRHDQLYEWTVCRDSFPQLLNNVTAPANLLYDSWGFFEVTGHMWSFGPIATLVYIFGAAVLVALTTLTHSCRALYTGLPFALLNAFACPLMIFFVNQLYLLELQKEDHGELSSCFISVAPYHWLNAAAFALPIFFFGLAAYVLFGWRALGGLSRHNSYNAAWLWRMICFTVIMIVVPLLALWFVGLVWAGFVLAQGSQTSLALYTVALLLLLEGVWVFHQTAMFPRYTPDDTTHAPEHDGEAAVVAPHVSKQGSLVASSASVSRSDV